MLPYVDVVRYISYLLHQDRPAGSGRVAGVLERTVWGVFLLFLYARHRICASLSGMVWDVIRK